MLKRIVLIFAVCFFLGAQIWAQDFGFGFDDEEDMASSSASRQRLALSVGGEVSAAIIGYFHDFPDGAENINTLEMFMLQGKLNFHAQSSFAEGVINLKFVPALIPVNLDEAYIRAFFGNFDLSAGLKKVTWGKADQLGPLDVINLIDASKIFLEMSDNTSLMGVKIANPIVHAVYRFGMFSKVEALFVPSFEVIGAAVSTAIAGADPTNPMNILIGSSSPGRWMPQQMENILTKIGEKAYVNPDLNVKNIIPKTSGIDYAQAGLRFTTTIGSADVGVQYFYGRLYQPALLETDDSIKILYNKYHQIGIDYAQVLAGFNVRAEFAANITEDIKGDKEHIFNPSIGYSFGFDRDIFAGININLQANGSVRLLDDKVGGADSYDIESGTSITATRLTAMLSKKFFRDTLELRTAFVWGIEGKTDGKWNGGDAAIIPALIWVKDDLRAALSGSFFLGYEDGQLGQYHDNSFLKISVVYVF